MHTFPCHLIDPKITEDKNEQSLLKLLFVGRKYLNNFALGGGSEIWHLQSTCILLTRTAFMISALYCVIIVIRAGICWPKH